MVSVEVTPVICIYYWVPCKSMWDLEGYVSSNAKTLCQFDNPIHYHYNYHFHYLGFQGLVFVLMQVVGLVVVVEYDEFVAVVVGITEHPILLWLHSGLGLTQGHSRPFTDIVLWT